MASIAERIGSSISRARDLLIRRPATPDVPQPASDFNPANLSFFEDFVRASQQAILKGEPLPTIGEYVKENPDEVGSLGPGQMFAMIVTFSAVQFSLQSLKTGEEGQVNAVDWIKQEFGEDPRARLGEIEETVELARKEV